MIIDPDKKKIYQIYITNPWTEDIIDDESLGFFYQFSLTLSMQQLKVSIVFIIDQCQMKRSIDTNLDRKRCNIKLIPPPPQRRLGLLLILWLTVVCSKVSHMSGADTNPCRRSSSHSTLVPCQPADWPNGQADQRGHTQLLGAWKSGRQKNLSNDPGEIHEAFIYILRRKQGGSIHVCSLQYWFSADKWLWLYIP